MGSEMCIRDRWDPQWRFWGLWPGTVEDRVAVVFGPLWVLLSPRLLWGLRWVWSGEPMHSGVRVAIPGVLRVLSQQVAV